MDILEEISKIKTHCEKIIWFAVLVMLFSFLFTLILPLKYRSSAEILVIQKQTSEIDPYTSAKSADRVANTLTKVIYSSSFFDKVLKSGYRIEEDSFSKEEIKRRKEWKKTVETKVIKGTGIFKVDVYHKDREQTKQIAHGIIYVLSKYGDEFHGGGKFIEIKTIDYPLTSKKPVKPNLILNVLLGFILGFILGVIYVFLKPNKNLEERNENEFSLSKTALASEVAPVAPVQKTDFSGVNPARNFTQHLFSKKSARISNRVDKNVRKKLEKIRKQTDKWSV